ncbi:MAG: hypothetical protein HC769_31990 [Cyanobacteria bacterium CRU_2_1]|nr:hypothetical protein [Cyanobacteria bacterium CRU_2_1]
MSVATKITELTRRYILNIFIKENHCWFGEFSEIDFLNRLYALEELPSSDERFDDASDDICQHRVKNHDWEDNWVFYDERFNLGDGEADDVLLKFLCETIHPILRTNQEEATYLLHAYNKLLAPDGYEIYPSSQISSRPVFGFREITPKTFTLLDHKMTLSVQPIQKILFGSPGTGKSYQIRKIAAEQLGILEEMTNQTVKTVFHPEYTYADFIGKLLPLSQNGSIRYRFYPGHFLTILGSAYQSLLSGKDDRFLLVIDELNRGNAAAIFGTVFQLLDREGDGWSSYEVGISDMEFFGLLEVMGFTPQIHDEGIHIKESYSTVLYKDHFKRKSEDSVNDNFTISKVYRLLMQRQISIPPNLSIIATINTSDESIYYLDSAFKRRWDWEYVQSPIGKIAFENIPDSLSSVKLFIGDEPKNFWYYYIVGINSFIISQAQYIRRIEDKQIGWWFIKPTDGKVELQKVKDKLLFYLWDSVFSRDKKPLEQFLDVKLPLYSDFLNNAESFMSKAFKLGEAEELYSLY